MSKGVEERATHSFSVSLKRRFSVKTVAEAMAELEERLHEAPLDTKCDNPACDRTWYKLGREDLYWFNTQDARDDVAQGVCPECEHSKEIPHVHLLILTGGLER